MRSPERVSRQEKKKSGGIALDIPEDPIVLTIAQTQCALFMKAIDRGECRNCERRKKENFQVSASKTQIADNCRDGCYPRLTQCTLGLGDNWDIAVTPEGNKKEKIEDKNTNAE
jgi:hypothetical protein